jgi:hypothetical protein
MYPRANVFRVNIIEPYFQEFSSISFLGFISYVEILKLYKMIDK